MGWSFYHRDKGETHAEHFAKELDPKYTILASATKGFTFYAAVKNIETGAVDGLVILFRWSTREFFNFGTKWMDESVGPCESEAPAKVLDLLTPTTSEWANEWRERCRKNLDRAAETKVKTATVKVGDVIRVKEPLNFTGGMKATDFQLRVGGNAKRWTANPGTMSAFGCRLPRDWARRYDWVKV